MSGGWLQVGMPQPQHAQNGGGRAPPHDRFTADPNAANASPRAFFSFSQFVDAASPARGGAVTTASKSFFPAGAAASAFWLPFAAAWLPEEASFFPAPPFADTFCFLFWWPPIGAAPSRDRFLPESQRENGSKFVGGRTFVLCKNSHKKLL